MRDKNGYKCAFFRNGVVIGCKSSNQLKKACKLAKRFEKCEYRFTLPNESWYNL